MKIVKILTSGYFINYVDSIKREFKEREEPTDFSLN